LTTHDKLIEPKPMHGRLEAATAGKTYRWIARVTGAHPETVRRYMQGQSPSVEFVTALCAQLKINAQWLLTGEGPMRRDEVRAHHLAEADPAELLAAIAATLDRLIERVDRLELFVQQLEVRISGDPAERLHEQASEPQGSQHESVPHERPARRVGGAVARRPHEDAH
jgi:transcriptional regulator with XRE-family HTH domain